MRKNILKNIRDVKKYVIFAVLILPLLILADPFEGITGEVLDSSLVTFKTMYAGREYDRFFVIDSLRYLDNDDDSTDFKYNEMVIKERIEFRLSRELTFGGLIPFKKVTYEFTDSADVKQSYESSGIGDIDLYFKYRPVATENPIVLLAGVIVPTGETNYDSENENPDPALGNGNLDAYVGVINVNKNRGFDITTNVYMVLSGLSKEVEDIDVDNYFVYNGAAEAPVLMNGSQIGAITGELQCKFASTDITDKYEVNGAIGLEWNPYDYLSLQASVNIPLLSSDYFSRSKVAPFVALKLDL